MSTHLVPLILHVVPPPLLLIVRNSIFIIILSFNPLPHIHSKWDGFLNKVSKCYEIPCTPVLRTCRVALLSNIRSSCGVCRLGSYIVTLTDLATGHLTSRLLAGVSWASLCWHWRLRFLTWNKCRDWRWLGTRQG